MNSEERSRALEMCERAKSWNFDNGWFKGCRPVGWDSGLIRRHITISNGLDRLELLKTTSETIPKERMVDACPELWWGYAFGLNGVESIARLQSIFKNIDKRPKKIKRIEGREIDVLKRNICDALQEDLKGVIEQFKKAKPFEYEMELQG